MEQSLRLWMGQTLAEWARPQQVKRPQRHPNHLQKMQRTWQATHLDLRAGWQHLDHWR